MKIRLLARDEFDQALELVWETFCKYEAVDYPEAGKESFYQAIHSEEYLDSLTVYGALEQEKLIGILATRNSGQHIALFFVDGAYQHQGVGRMLWTTLQKENPKERITVHSSLYAREIYKKLGFQELGDIRESDGIRYIPMEYRRSGIIVYGSCYGSSRQYALKLSELTGITAVSYETVTDLDPYSRIFYIGGLYAGGVLGMKKTFQKLSVINGKQITIATVGLADPEDEENIRSIQKSMSKQLSPEIFRTAEIFHLRGGMDYSKLRFPHKTMMAMLYRKALALPEEKKTADARALIETYNQRVDFTDFSRLFQLLSKS